MYALKRENVRSSGRRRCVRCLSCVCAARVDRVRCRDELQVVVEHETMAMTIAGTMAMRGWALAMRWKCGLDDAERLNKLSRCRRRPRGLQSQSRTKLEHLAVLQHEDEPRDDEAQTPSRHRLCPAATQHDRPPASTAGLAELEK